MAGRGMHHTSKTLVGAVGEVGGVFSMSVLNKVRLPPIGKTNGQNI